MDHFDKGALRVLMAVLMAAMLAGCSTSPFLPGAGCNARGMALPWRLPAFLAKAPAKKPPAPVFAFPAVHQRPASYAEDSAVYVFAGAPVDVPADALPTPDAVGDNTLTELPIWDSIPAEEEH